MRPNCQRKEELSNQHGYCTKGRGAKDPSGRRRRDPRTLASPRHWLLQVVAATAGLTLYAITSGIPAALVWQSSWSCTRVPSWPWCTTFLHLRVDLLERGTGYWEIHTYLLPIVSSSVFLCMPSFRRCGVTGTVCCGSGCFPSLPLRRLCLFFNVCVVSCKPMTCKGRVSQRSELSSLATDHPEQ